MGESERHYAKLKEARLKGYMSYDDIYVTFWKRGKTMGTKNWSEVARG